MSSSSSSYKAQAASEAKAREYYESSSNYRTSILDEGCGSVAGSERIVPVQFHRSTDFVSTSSPFDGDYIPSGSGLGSSSTRLSRRSSRIGDESNVGELNNIFQKMYMRHRNSVVNSSSSEDHQSSSTARRFSYSTRIN